MHRGPGLGNDTGDAVITKDGKNVYVASVEKDAIVAFESQPPRTAG